MRWFLIALVLVVGAALLSCGGRSNATERTDAPASSPTSKEVGVFSQAAKNVWLPEASAYQHALLDDGKLTLTEYEMAKLAQVACLRQAGLTVLEPIRLNGLLKFKLTVTAPAEQVDARDLIHNCKEEYADVVDVIWSEVSLPLVQDAIRESRKLMSECYRDHGLKVEERPFDSSDPAVRQRHDDCVQQVDAQLDLGGVSYGVDGDGRPD